MGLVLALSAAIWAGHSFGFGYDLGTRRQWPGLALGRPFPDHSRRASYLLPSPGSARRFNVILLARPLIGREGGRARDFVWLRYLVPGLMGSPLIPIICGLPTPAGVNQAASEEGVKCCEVGPRRSCASPPRPLFGLTVPKSEGGISESPSQPWRRSLRPLVRIGETGEGFPPIPTRSPPSPPASLPQFVKRFFTPVRLGYVYQEGPVQRLQRAMQAGRQGRCQQLEQLKFNLPSSDLADAAWAIAYWNRLNGDYRRALDHLLIRRLADPHVLWDRRHIVLEVDALLKLGRVDSAAPRLNMRSSGWARSPSFAFVQRMSPPPARAEPHSRRTNSLSSLNKPFVAASLAPIE